MTSEIATIVHWPVPWEIGAPMPFVIAAGRTFIIYYATANLPPVDPGVFKVIGHINPEKCIALVEFLGCLDFRFGGPSEEDFGGPATIRGLTPHKAHVVQNSAWIEWLKKVQDTSRERQAMSWSNYKHFVLSFHDERFECVAKSYFIEVYASDYDDVLQIALDRTIGKE